MKLDQFAEEASRDAKQAGRTMPIVPIEKLRRRRLYLMAPMITAGVAASVLAVVFLLPTTAPQQPADEGPTATAIDVATTTTTPSPTTTTPQIVATPDTAWVRGTVEQIFDDQGTVLFEFPSTILYGRNTAWDGGDGFVALTEAGLVWMRPDQRQTIDAPFGTILDVAITETGTHVVGIQAAEDRLVSWIELETGDEVEAPSTARTNDGKTFSYSDRTVTIVDPDWSDEEKDETGMPLPPFDLPELVVTDGGTEVLRITVGSEERPFVEIHDFDGRRLVIGALPVEPAVPPSTVWIIDLECSDCTQRFDTPSLEYFDLIGVVPSEGGVVEPELS